MARGGPAQAFPGAAAAACRADGVALLRPDAGSQRNHALARRPGDRTPKLDGAVDGSDLPTRGRLAAMLERRTRFVPGKELLPHLRAKHSAAARKQVR